LAGVDGLEGVVGVDAPLLGDEEPELVPELVVEVPAPALEPAPALVVEEPAGAAESVVFAGATSAVNGLREGPRRWWEAPLVVSATGWSGFVLDCVTAMPEVTGNVGVTAAVGAALEPPSTA
jgi:hypothetical protein